MQVFTRPIEGNLNICMELGDVGATGNQQTPPDHRADTGQHESQLVNRWRLWNVAHTPSLASESLPPPDESARRSGVTPPFALPPTIVTGTSGTSVEIHRPVRC